MLRWPGPVSYTHLDVYKRQVFIAMLERGSNTIQTNFKIPASASDLIIGIILFFMLGCEFFITYKLIPRRKEEHHD